MYYSVFEGIPYDDKADLAGQMYINLLPHVKKVEGFHEDGFSVSPHAANKAVNIAVWADANAVWRWRNESHHLRAQKKGGYAIYQSYRLRLGAEVSADSELDTDKAKQWMTLLYRNFEGTPSDDVMSLLDGTAAADMQEEVLDSIVYQGAHTVWIAGWPSKSAAMNFSRSVQRPGDNIVLIRIDRDYTKIDRKDAWVLTLFGRCL